MSLQAGAATHEEAGGEGGGGGGGGGNNDLYLVSHADFCVYGPREAGKEIASVGQDVVSWCTTSVSLYSLSRFEIGKADKSESRESSDTRGHIRRNHICQDAQLRPSLRDVSHHTAGGIPTLQVHAKLGHC